MAPPFAYPSHRHISLRGGGVGGVRSRSEIVSGLCGLLESARGRSAPTESVAGRTAKPLEPPKTRDSSPHPSRIDASETWGSSAFASQMGHAHAAWPGCAAQWHTCERSAASRRPTIGNTLHMASGARSNATMTTSAARIVRSRSIVASCRQMRRRAFGEWMPPPTRGRTPVRTRHLGPARAS